MPAPKTPVSLLPTMLAFKHMLRLLADHWKPIARLALPWLALIALLNIVSLLSQTPVTSSDPVLRFSWVDAISVVIGMLATASISVSWHRYILLDAPLTAEPHFRLDAVVWRYLARSLLIYALCFIPFVAIMLFASMAPGVLVILALVLFIQLAVFVCRMSVSLPALAIGNQSFSIRHAMEITRGNNVKILGLMLITYVLITLVFLLFAWAVAGLGPSHPQLAVATMVMIGIPIQLLYLLLNATMLTSLYGFFVEHRNF